MDWVVWTAYFHSSKVLLVASSVVVGCAAEVVLEPDGLGGPDFARLVYKLPSMMVLLK